MQDLKISGINVKRDDPVPLGGGPLDFLADVR
jgi:hypothetical protein